MKDRWNERNAGEAESEFRKSSRRQSRHMDNVMLVEDDNTSLSNTKDLPPDDLASLREEEQVAPRRSSMKRIQELRRQMENLVPAQTLTANQSREEDATTGYEPTTITAEPEPGYSTRRSSRGMTPRAGYCADTSTNGEYSRVAEPKRTRFDDLLNRCFSGLSTTTASASNGTSKQNSREKRTHCGSVIDTGGLTARPSASSSIRNRVCAGGEGSDKIRRMIDDMQSTFFGATTAAGVQKRDIENCRPTSIIKPRLCERRETSGISMTRRVLGSAKASEIRRTEPPLQLQFQLRQEKSMKKSRPEAVAEPATKTPGGKRAVLSFQLESVLGGATVLPQSGAGQRVVLNRFVALWAKDE